MRIIDLTTHPRRGLFAIGAVLAVVLAGFLLGYARRPMPLHEHARILHQAILEEDGATILRYVHPVEAELNDLTPETAAALVSEMINARYEAWGWVPEGGVVSFSASENSAIAEQMGRIPGAGRETRSVEVWQSEGIAGGRPVFMLSSQVVATWAWESTWELRKQGQGLGALTPSAMAKAWMVGLDRDERRLRELGVRYQASPHFHAGMVRFTTLAGLRRIKQDWLDDSEALFRDPHGHAYRMGHLKYWMTADQAREHKRQASREDQ